MPWAWPPPADGSALILSFRRMKAIRSIDPDCNRAIAEAGVILSSAIRAYVCTRCLKSGRVEKAV